MLCSAISVAMTHLQNMVCFSLAIIIISAMFCVLLMAFGAVVTCLSCAHKNNGDEGGIGIEDANLDGKDRSAYS